MITQGEFFYFLKKFKGIKLNKTLLQDIDLATRKFIASIDNQKKIKQIRKAEKELSSFYNLRLKNANKNRLSFSEFQALNGKVENKQNRDKITQRRLYTKYAKGLSEKDEKRFKKLLKERIYTTSRLLRNDGEADDMYRYILGNVSSNVDGLNDNDYKRLKKGIEKRARNDRHFELILDSQKALLRSNMDALKDEITDAIGFIWETQVDERVVGNPTGLYPKVYDEYAHGDHWEREGKLYIYPNCSAMRKGFINTKSSEYRSVSDLKDGRPAQAYNCRCEALSVRLLSEVLDYDESLLTKKGREFLKNHI